MMRFNQPFQSDTNVVASIVIVNYNGLQTIGTCLQSVYETLGEEVELIVVDNQSTDGSPDYIRTHFPEVRLIHNARNGGFGSGNNLGAAYACGQYLVFLNPDTRVSGDWLKPLIEQLSADERLGIATAKLLLMDAPDTINTCGNDVHFTGVTLCRGMGAAAATFNEVTEVSAASGAAFAMRRTVFDAVNGFDEMMFMYMDDTDLSLRVQQAGYKCVYVPESVIYHDYALRFGPSKTFFQERNRYIMLLKLFRWRTLLLLLPALLLSEMITWGFVLVRERRNYTNKLRAYASVLRDWTTIIERRHAVQSIRCVSDHELLQRLTYHIQYELTGGGPIAKIAHLIFDPIFHIIQALSLRIVRW